MQRFNQMCAAWKIKLNNNTYIRVTDTCIICSQANNTKSMTTEILSKSLSHNKPIAQSEFLFSHRFPTIKALSATSFLYFSLIDSAPLQFSPSCAKRFQPTPLSVFPTKCISIQHSPSWASTNFNSSSLPNPSPTEIQNNSGRRKTR